MTLEARIDRLEQELASTKAVLDGSEMFTREACAAAISLVAWHLHQRGTLEAEALQTYLQRHGGDPRDHEDHQGELIRNVAAFLKSYLQDLPDVPAAAA